MAERLFSSKGSRRGRAARERRDRWAGIMARFERSGLTQQAFCSREGVPFSTFHFWRQRLKGRNGHERRRSSLTGRRRRPSFLSVRVLDSVRSSSSPFEIALPGGSVVRVPSEFDPEVLRKLLSVLTDPTC